LKTLVTGGTGLIGSAIDAEYKISSKWDLREMSQAKEVFSKINPEAVIHCAAKVGGLGANMSKKGEFFFDNIMMNTNVIECARLYGVKKLVAFLSTCVFPDSVEYPIDESKIHLGEPHSSNYPYAYAKRMLDVQVRAYREQYGLNYTCIIPTNVYGPNDNFNLADGHVIPSLIHKCYIAKKTGSPFEVWGTGSPMREFIFSRDVAMLSKRILEEYDEIDPIIVSTSEEISINEVVEIIRRSMRYNGKIKWLLDKPDGQHRKPSDNKKLKELFPDFSFTSLEDGISETVEWFEKNYEKARK
jgi:GDP-L-fucose synthase